MCIRDRNIIECNEKLPAVEKCSPKYSDVGLLASRQIFTALALALKVDVLALALVLEVSVLVTH